MYMCIYIHIHAYTYVYLPRLFFNRIYLSLFLSLSSLSLT